MSTSDLRAFGCISEGIEKVAAVMARYEVIEKRYLMPTAPSCSRESQLLSDCVIKVYTILLNYLTKARNFWSKNSAKRMANALFTNVEAGHNEMQSALEKADDETNRTIHLSRDQQRTHESKVIRELLDRLLQETMLPVVRIARDISKINDKLDKDERREILRWLSTVPCETQHQEAVRKIVKGTGGWLLDQPELRDWQSSSASAILWLHGIPGSGKSKLTSIIVESLLEQHRSSPAISPPLAYFYCSKKGADTRSRNPLEVLCALLRQLVVRDAQSPLRGSVALDYERRKELFNETGAQVPRLNIDEVVRHILDITRDDPIVIVIDALDEVEEAERGGLFRSLKRLLQESQNVAKIFVSSRTDGDIVESFEQYPNVGIEESMNGEDIRNFVKQKIQEAIETKRLLRGRVSPSLQQDIIETLTRRAQGMYVLYRESCEIHSLWQVQMGRTQHRDDFKL